jgi:hypothetical protein
LYEVPWELNKVVNRLIRIHNKFHITRYPISTYTDNILNSADNEKIRSRNRLFLSTTALLYKKDSWKNKYLLRKLDTARFEKLKKLLFDAHVVLALSYANISTIHLAKEHLNLARSTNPEICDNNALYLLTKSETELKLEQKIQLLIQATELAPKFEIAQYLLAKNKLLEFLAEGEVVKERAKPVIREFNNVFTINPGNIAASAYLGYLYWLIDDLDQSKKQFEQGIKAKAISQQTFIGELNYGLARIAAKNGEFNRCFDLYSEALASEPGLGAYSIESISGKTRALGYYEFITPSVVDRYESYKNNFESQIRLAFCLIHQNDLVNLYSLKKKMAEDEYRIPEYLKVNASKFDSGSAEKQGPEEEKALIDQLNVLIPDSQFHQYIIKRNVGLTNRINALKKKVKFKPDDPRSVAELNRAIFEILYPKLIRKKNIKKYFKQYTSPRSLMETTGQEITIHTLNKSYSYVLNDYANACLSCYHRFGDLNQLDNAITAFEKALHLNPENGIAYYNIANAFYWRYVENDDRSDFQKQGRHFF